MKNALRFAILVCAAWYSARWRKFPKRITLALHPVVQFNDKVYHLFLAGFGVELSSPFADECGNFRIHGSNSTAPSKLRCRSAQFQKEVDRG